MVIIDSDSRAVGFSLRTGYYLAHCSLAAYGGRAIGRRPLPWAIRSAPSSAAHSMDSSPRRGTWRSSPFAARCRSATP